MTDGERSSVVDGDCLDVMRGMDADIIDAIVTDPPYGLAFMGKEWDRGVPGEAFWVEALRVAKPGAHLLAFGGTRTHHRLMVAIEDAGWEIRDCLMWLYGTGFPKSHNGPWGGTALKPAWEPIIMARKPLAGTVAQNVEDHGTGGINVDGCRVGSEVRVNPSARNAPGGASLCMSRNGMPDAAPRECVGRWPANVILDAEAGAVLDEQAGDRPSGSRAAGVRGSSDNWSGRFSGDGGPAIESSNGGPSRFFYCPKASKDDRTCGGKVENKHPTVKPRDLMRYLARLVTPPGGTVLDPFCGSGSTGIGAAMEGFSFVGIEKDPESAETARARITEAGKSAPLFLGGVT